MFILAIIVIRSGGLIVLFCGIPLLGLVWFMIPRFNKAPEETLSRTKFPKLYQFIDRIADAMHTPHIDTITLNEVYNAGVMRYGYRQKRHLIIGYQMWAHLLSQERVALIAHELGHNLNKDFARSWMVGSAIRALVEWYRLLYPQCLFCPHEGIFGVIPRLGMLWLANGGMMVIFVLRHLLLYESRRAEYMADYLASTISGTDAVVSMLGKLQMREAGLSISLLDSTHPQTQQRIDFLKARYLEAATFVLSNEEAAELDQELSVLDAEMTARIQRLRQRGGY